MWRGLGKRTTCLRWGGERQGQSILEYLVIATLIVGAIFLVRDTVKTHLETLYGNARDKVGAAATAVGGLKVEGEVTTPKKPGG